MEKWPVTLSLADKLVAALFGEGSSHLATDHARAVPISMHATTATTYD